VAGGAKVNPATKRSFDFTQTWRTDSKSPTVGRTMSLKAFRAVCVDGSSLS
jgi:hypothetical protein